MNKNMMLYFLIRNMRMFRLLSDKLYLIIIYKLRMGKNIDLKNPQTFNEKLQWLKLYDRNPKYTKMVDKYEVKEYIKEKIGEEYLIPTLGVYNNFDEIDFDKLPNQFVIKCTHDSGGLVICRDKKKINLKEAKMKINSSLKRNYYYSTREWPYKNVKPRIIIEKYMEDKEQKTLKDYKFYCFYGEPKFLYVSEGLENHKTAKISFFDMDFNFAGFGRKDFNQFDKKIKKPNNFKKMQELAKRLSTGHTFLRVDFYEINDKIYFGELTFTPCAGFCPFDPEEYDKILGDMLILPIGKKEGKNEK